MADKSGVSIDKITLKIGDTKVAVTMDQAKALHAALSEMFGGHKTIIERHYDNWRWPWTQPMVTWTSSSSDGASFAYPLNSTATQPDGLQLQNNAVSGFTLAID